MSASHLTTVFLALCSSVVYSNIRDIPIISDNYTKRIKKMKEVLVFNLQFVAFLLGNVMVW